MALPPLGPPRGQPSHRDRAGDAHGRDAGRQPGQQRILGAAEQSAAHRDPEQRDRSDVDRAGDQEQEHRPLGDPLDRNSA
jgi:hypothetical protein